MTENQELFREWCDDIGGALSTEDRGSIDTLGCRLHNKTVMLHTGDEGESMSWNDDLGQRETGDIDEMYRSAISSDELIVKHTGPEGDQHSNTFRPRKTFEVR